MKKIIREERWTIEDDEPAVVVETDGFLWNFAVGDVIQQDDNPLFSCEVLGFRYRDQSRIKSIGAGLASTGGFGYGGQLWVKGKETGDIFYFESPRGLLLISHPGMKFKAGDQVKMFSGVFAAGETGKIAVIDPEAPVCSFLVEFDFEGRDGQTNAEASWERPWFPKAHKFQKRKYFWASENYMEGVMKKVVYAKDGREIEVEIEGEMWGFKADDVIIDENEDENKRLVIQGFRGNMIWVCGVNGGGARPLVKPEGLLLVERPGLKFAVGGIVRIISGTGMGSVGTVVVIDPFDAAKELNNKPAFPYYVEIDFHGDEYEADRIKNPWYPKKRGTNKQRIMCGEHEIERWDEEKEIASSRRGGTRNDGEGEIVSENSAPERKWPDSLEAADGAPEWLKEMALKIKAGVSHFFILWGNIHDLQKITSDANPRTLANKEKGGEIASSRHGGTRNDGKENPRNDGKTVAPRNDGTEARPQQKQISTEFISLEQCLIEVLGNGGNPPVGGPVMFYSISKGLYFADADSAGSPQAADETRFRGRYILKKAEKVPPKPRNQMSEAEKLAEEREQAEQKSPLIEIIGKGPDKVFPFLEKFVLTDKSGPKILIIDFGHNVAPAETGTSDRYDRETIETLEYWARDKKIREAGGVVILLTPHLVDVADSLRAPHSGAAAIKIPKPNEEERTSQWERLIATDGTKIQDGLNAETLGRITNGLSLNQIITVHSLAKVKNTPLDLVLIKKKKQEILETEFSGDVLRVTVPEFGFDYFGNMEKAKEYMLEVRDNILKGVLRRVPMGILASGPPGTGKTFFFECFAYECGFNFVKIVNPQDMWVGASEKRMAKILSALDDVSPVIVLEDEADQSEAPRGSPVGDSGVSNHLRQMKFEFCSDPKRRGKVIWVRITNRPDLIDAAYKRKGRSDDHMAFVMPNAAACAKIFEVIFKRYEIPTNIADFSIFGEKAAAKIYCTGADIEWMALEADKIAGREGKEKVGKKHLLKTIEGWSPKTRPEILDHQIILALEEADEHLKPDDWKKTLADAFARKFEREKIKR